jgi:hypothetical protein
MSLKDFLRPLSTRTNSIGRPLDLVDPISGSPTFSATFSIAARSSLSVQFNFYRKLGRGSPDPAADSGRQSFCTLRKARARCCSRLFTVLI